MHPKRVSSYGLLHRDISLAFHLRSWQSSLHILDYMSIWWAEMFKESLFALIQGYYITLLALSFSFSFSFLWLLSIKIIILTEVIPLAASLVSGNLGALLWKRLYPRLGKWSVVTKMCSWGWTCWAAVTRPTFYKDMWEGICRTAEYTLSALGHL